MTLSTQFITMLTMIGIGSYIGAALDTYNRFLQRSKRKGWIVFCNDILFWTFQGLSTFYTLFLVNKGELRFYIFLAILCGFAAYQSLFKRGYLRLLEIIITVIISIYRFIVKLLLLLIYKPIRALVMALLSIIIIAGKGLLALAMVVLKILSFILSVLFKPFKWLFMIVWGLLPKKLVNIIRKICYKFAGFSKKMKNIITNRKEK